MTTNHHTPLPTSDSGQKPEMTGELFNTPLGELDAAISTADGVGGVIPGGRLTLTSDVPVLTSDVTAATTIYYTPYIHTFIPLYDGADWILFEFAELSLAVPSTIDTNYDMFIYDNAGTITLEALAWTNDTTRTTAIVRQDGRLVKSGATTRLYLGSFRTTGVSGQTEMSFQSSATVRKCFLWNYYNRVEYKPEIAGTTSHTYSAAVWRNWNNVAHTVEFIIGVLEDAMVIRVKGNITGGGVHYPRISLSSSATASSPPQIIFPNVATGSMDQGNSRAIATTLGYSIRYLIEYGNASAPTITSSAASLDLKG